MLNALWLYQTSESEMVISYTPRYMWVFNVISGYARLQGGPLLDLLVLNGVIGLINGIKWVCLGS